jgi:hypothetical protein
VFDPSLSRGKIFCLVTAGWWESWCEYTGFDRDTVPASSSESPPSPSSSSAPPPFEDIGDSGVKKSDIRPRAIDNRALLQVLHPSSPILSLHPHLQEHTDFVFLNAAAFALLQSWYGGGPVVERRVVVRGLMEELLIELHPVSLLFCYVDESGRMIREVRRPAGEEPREGKEEHEWEERRRAEQARLRVFSKDTTLRGIIDELRPPFAVRETGEKLEGRIWRRVDREESKQHAAQLSAELSNGIKSENGSSAGHEGDEEGVRWELVHEKEYSNTLEFLDWTSGIEIALEYRHPQDPQRWCRSAGVKGSRWREFEVGDDIDAMDTQNKCQPSQTLCTSSPSLLSSRQPSLTVCFFCLSASVSVQGTSLSSVRLILRRASCSFTSRAGQTNVSSCYSLQCTQCLRFLSPCLSLLHAPALTCGCCLCPVLLLRSGDEWQPVDSAKLGPKSLFTTGAKEPYSKSSSLQRDVNKYNTQGRPVEKGAVGLRNLGNTSAHRDTAATASSVPASLSPPSLPCISALFIQLLHEFNHTEHDPDASADRLLH